MLTICIINHSFVIFINRLMICMKKMTHLYYLRHSAIPSSQIMNCLQSLSVMFHNTNIYKLFYHFLLLWHLFICHFWTYRLITFHMVWGNNIFQHTATYLYYCSGFINKELSSSILLFLYNNNTVQPTYFDNAYIGIISISWFFLSVKKRMKR